VLIEQRIAAGDEVSIAGFGKSSTSERSAPRPRPQTGETIEIGATTAPKFSVATQLKVGVKA
jgi:DNA-binding protein HU-beta